MIKNIEEKNNLLLTRFESSSPKNFMPESYNPGRPLLTQQSSPKAIEAQFWSPQRNYTSNKDSTLMLNPPTITIETQPDFVFNSPPKNRAYATKLNIAEQGLRPQSEGVQMKQQGAGRSSVKGVEESLEELKKFFDGRDTTLLKEFDDIVGNAKAKINSLGSDFNNIIEARSVRRDESGQQKIDHSMAYLKSFVKERLEGINRSIIRLSNLTKKTLGDSINKENTGLLVAYQLKILKFLIVL